MIKAITRPLVAWAFPIFALAHLWANIPPHAMDDAYTTDWSTTLVVDAPGLLSNDTDEDGDVLEAHLDQGVSQGYLSLRRDGSFTYVPVPGYSGDITFRYKAWDGKAIAFATVTLTVTEGNLAPVAVDDSYRVEAGVRFQIGAPGVMSNDYDPEGATLVSYLVNPLPEGTGKLGFHQDGSLWYEPQDFVGSTSFGYKVSDGSRTSSATVTLEVVFDYTQAQVMALSDTYINEALPNRNYNQSAYLRLQQTPAQRALLRFDRSALAAALRGGRLVSAHLELFIEQTDGRWPAEGAPLALYEVTETWNTEAVTWACSEDVDLTNDDAECEVSWQGGPHGLEPIATRWLTNEMRGRVRFEVTGAVEALLSSGSHEGWLLRKLEEGTNGIVDFSATERGLNHEPRLVLTIEHPQQDVIAPQISFTRPQALVVGEANPEIAVTYSDSGSGLSLDTLAVMLDGIPLVCYVASDGAVCTAPQLTEGVHQLTANISDNMGQTAYTSLNLHVFLEADLQEIIQDAESLTYLDGGMPDENFSALNHVSVGLAGPRRALMGWDGENLATLIGDGELLAAWLELPITENDRNWGDEGGLLDLHVVSLPWTEQGATWHCADDLDISNSEPDCQAPWDGAVFDGTPLLQFRVDHETRFRLSGDVTQSVLDAVAQGDTLSFLLKKHQERVAGSIHFGDEGQVPRLKLITRGAPLPDTTPPLITVGYEPLPNAAGWFNAPLTLSFTCQDEGGVASCPDSITVDQDGANQEFRVSATDAAGNTSEAVVVVHLDTVAPLVEVDSPTQGGVLDTPEVLIQGTVSDALSGVASVHCNGTNAEIIGGSFTCTLVLEDGLHTLSVSALDVSGNETLVELSVMIQSGQRDTDADGMPDEWESAYGLDGQDPSDAALDGDGDGWTNLEEYTNHTHPFDDGSVPPLTWAQVSPGAGEVGVAVTRETIVRFSRPLAPSVQLSLESFHASFAGAVLPGQVRLSANRKIVTLFYNNTLPAGARVQVSLDGSGLLDETGRLVDVDGDGIHGGTANWSFDTLTLTSVQGTIVCGRIFASQLLLVNGQNEWVNEPLAGVTISVDGLEDSFFAVSDNYGNFRLDPAPAGEFFVHINGSTSTNNMPQGSYYPVVGKSWRSRAGEETSIGEVYLPLVSDGTLQVVSDETDTTISFPDAVVAEFPELAGVTLTVPAGSLYANDGTTGGRVGIAPVDPARLPGTLPSALGFALVITVQTDGATNFDTPVPVCFPNLPDPTTGELLLPGASSALWSFNHDIGRWEIVGSMTVSEDGTLVCTDPGVGIRAPGWHGTRPGTSGEGGGPGKAGDDDEAPCEDPCGCGAAGSPGGSGSEGGAGPGGGAGSGGEGGPGNSEPSGSASGGSGPPSGGNVSDPVYLFSGEQVMQHEDLRIKGRGMDFIWSRRYRSKKNISSELGFGWDYTYNIRLIEDGRMVEVCDGSGRRDAFRPKPDNTYVRNGFFRELIKASDGTFKLIFADNGRWEFHGFDGSPQAGKISRIVDRNDNVIRLLYDEDGRLETVIDTLDRSIAIAYNNDGFIQSVTDFSGRTLTYDYYQNGDSDGSFGDLRSMTSPSVIGTPNGNDFPNGIVTSYTYSKGYSRNELNHNLLTVTDGRRNDPNDPTFGQAPIIRNVYATTTDPNHPDFDRVVRQEWGGNIVDFYYVHQKATAENHLVNTRTIVNDRNGNVKEFFYNVQNLLVAVREYTGLANPILATTDLDNRPTGKLRPDDPDYFETQYTWNDDFLVTRIQQPNGNITEYVYESTEDPGLHARRRGNLARKRLLPGGHLPRGDQQVIEEVYAYGADFACSGCGAQNFATSYTNGEGKTISRVLDDHGNVLRKTESIGTIFTDFRYNEFGQVTERIMPDNGNGHRRRDVFTYYTSGPQRGYLKEIIIDADDLALTTTYAYDSVGHQVSMVDPNGHDTRYIYNALDKLVRKIEREVTDGSGLRYETDTHYDANGNIIREDRLNVDDQGQRQVNTHISTSYEYEMLNNPIRKIDEVSQGHFVITEYEYDGNRNQTLIRHGEAVNGNQPTNVERKSYDERDMLFRETSGYGSAGQRTVQHDYDGNGNPSRETDGLEGEPDVYEFTYDGYNRQVSARDPMGNLELRTYNANHVPVGIRVFGELEDRDQNDDNVLLFELAATYDDMDRMTRVERAYFDVETHEALEGGLAIEEFVYSDFGQIKQTVDPNGNELVFDYDTANRRLSATDAKGNVITFGYDANSNNVLVTHLEKSDLGEPDEHFVTQLTYDNLDRLIEMNVDGHKYQFGFDSHNNRTREVDAQRVDANSLGNLVTHEFDGLNRLLRTTRYLTANGMGGGTPVGQVVTQQVWDDSSRLVTQIDPNGNLTRMEYDALNREYRKTYADGGVESHVFDLHGNPLIFQDPNGTVVNQAFDHVGRLVSRDVHPGPGVSNATTFERFTYDGLGRLVGAENDHSRLELGYNSLSLRAFERLDGMETRQHYDGMGNLVALDYPGGNRVEMTYDALNRLSHIGDDNGVTAHYAYVGQERVSRRDDGNGISLFKTYDTAKRLTGTAFVRDPEGQALMLDQRIYGRDGVENKTSQTDVLKGTTQSYGLDSLYRLVRSENQTSGEMLNYSYDEAGNRTAVSGGSHAGAYTMSSTGDRSLNQYTQTPFDQRDYDANGNLIQAGTHTWVYDFRNRPVSYRDSATGVVSTYRYDAISRRIERNVGGSEITRYAYHQDQIIEERDGANRLTATFVYGPYLDEVLSMRRDGAVFYYLSDDQYSVVGITDENGDLVESYGYDDFGIPTVFSPAGVRRESSLVGNPYFFQGRQLDTESGLYYFRSRYLDPRAGRFTTLDTIGIWGDPKALGNGYSFLANNPQTYVDPLGLQVTEPTNATIFYGEWKPFSAHCKPPGTSLSWIDERPRGKWFPSKITRRWDATKCKCHVVTTKYKIDKVRYYGTISSTTSLGIYCKYWVRLTRRQIFTTGPPVTDRQDTLTPKAACH